MLKDKLKENTNLSFIDTTAMSREDWLLSRKAGIGGSDASALMNMNKYKTPLSLYIDKMGLTPQDKEAMQGNNATRRGNLLEGVVRGECQNELQKIAQYDTKEVAKVESADLLPQVKIEEVGAIIKNATLPYMIANLDGLIEIKNCTIELQGTKYTGLGGHEIKTSNSGEGFTEIEIPDAYYCQVQHYMAVTGLPFFILSCYMTRSDTIRHYGIPRNEAFIAELQKAILAFYSEHILKNIAPEPCGNDYEDDAINAMLQDDGGEVKVELGASAETINRYCQRIKELEAVIKEQETEVLKMKSCIKMALIQNAGLSDKDENTKIKCDLPQYKISWGTSERRSVDTEALKRDALYTKYSKVSTVKTLRITAKKGE